MHEYFRGARNSNVFLSSCRFHTSLQIYTFAVPMVPDRLSSGFALTPQRTKRTAELAEGSQVVLPRMKACICFINKTVIICITAASKEVQNWAYMVNMVWSD